MTVRYHARRGTEAPDYYCGREAIDQAAALPGHPRRRCRRRDRRAAAGPPSPPSPSRSPSPSKPNWKPAPPKPTPAPPAMSNAPGTAPTARRRYLAVDPDNRLVADTLEADWNDALRALQAAQDDYDHATAAASRAHRRAQGPHPGAGRRLPRAVDEPGHPAAGTQTHGPAAHRGRHHHQDRPDPPARPVPRRPDHQPDHPHPAHAWQPARPTPTPSPCSTGCSTTTPTPNRRRTQRRRSPLRQRKALHRPDRARATPQQPPAQPRRTAPRPRPAHPHRDRRTARRAPRHHQGLAPRRPAHRTKANDKNVRLFEPPDPGDPRLVKRRGSSSPAEFHPTTPGGAV